MMKDLDFDELDQAVNSLMTGIPRTPAPRDDKVAEKTLTITPTLSDNERPSFATLEQTASKAGIEIETVEASATAPALANSLAARRTGGRFMDVVHPSSDMKVNNRPVVSREGIQLSPIAPRSVEATPQPAREAEVAATPSEQISEETMEQKPEVSVWPDPIDMVSAEPADTPGTTTAAEEATQLLPEVAMPDEFDEPAPLQTPFLADTKVEKRPLGAFAVDQVAIDNITQEAVETPVDNDAEETTPLASSFSMPTQEAASDLPDELQHDLIKIESDNEIEVSGSESETPQEEPSPEKITTPVPSFAAPIVTPAPVAVSGPASIQPQYKEEPSSTKEEHAAIYDTDTYHKPLAHPAKKKSGWLWVVWIILLLALGAGGAAALYYFKII